MARTRSLSFIASGELIVMILILLQGQTLRRLPNSNLWVVCTVYPFLYTTPCQRDRGYIAHPIILLPAISKGKYYYYSTRLQYCCPSFCCAHNKCIFLKLSRFFLVLGHNGSVVYQCSLSIYYVAVVSGIRSRVSCQQFSFPGEATFPSAVLDEEVLLMWIQARSITNSAFKSVSVHCSRRYNNDKTLLTWCYKLDVPVSRFLC